MGAAGLTVTADAVGAVFEMTRVAEVCTGPHAPPLSQGVTVKYQLWPFTTLAPGTVARFCSDACTAPLRYQWVVEPDSSWLSGSLYVYARVSASPR